jgi:hypothetical protein
MADALVVVIATLFGALIGSFLNVVWWRVPRGESVVRPGSHSPSCGTPLHAYELVPVLSWVALRGRCRTCGLHISARYPLVELAARSYSASSPTSSSRDPRRAATTGLGVGGRDGTTRRGYHCISLLSAWLPHRSSRAPLVSAIRQGAERVRTGARADRRDRYRSTFVVSVVVRATLRLPVRL